MKSKKTIIALTILLAVLALGIGYATISNVVLNISGSAAASADASNFNVGFDTSKTPAGTATVGTAEGSYTDAKNATMTVSGLTTAGQSATVTYTVKNSSPDLTANLSATVKNNGTNASYFTVSDPVFNSATLKSGESTTVAITVTLNQTPINDVSADFSVTLTAAPAEQ